MEQFRDPQTGAVTFGSGETIGRLRAEAEDGGEGGSKALADQTKGELVEYAEANDIDIDAKAKKDEIREAIEAAEAEDGGE